MRCSLRLLTLAVSTVALWCFVGVQATMAVTSEDQDIGTKDINVSVGCDGDSYPVSVDASPNTAPRYTYVVEHPLAQFISVHFSLFNLPPEDYVVIRPTNKTSDEKSFTYKGYRPPFFSDSIYVKSVTVELYTSGSADGVNASHPTGFTIDNFQYMAQAPTFGDYGLESVCGADQTDEVMCFQDRPTVVKRANAVMRLLIRKDVTEDGVTKRKSYFCTGWLVGSEGHVMTNNHCIENQDHATDTEFMFEAQGQTCKEFCGVAFGCSSTITQKSSQLLISSKEFDYAIVKIDKKWADKYGYLQIRAKGAKLRERIYIVQHPAGWGKRVALKTDDGSFGEITSLTAPGCIAKQVAYALDTQGGSSGSPVFSADDDTVIAIHHCGGCDNTAVNMDQIVTHIKKVEKERKHAKEKDCELLPESAYA